MFYRTAAVKISLQENIAGAIIFQVLIEAGNFADVSRTPSRGCSLLINLKTSVH